MSDTSDVLTKLKNNRSSRRRFVGQAGLASLGVLGINHLAGIAVAQTGGPVLSDANIFNFALNLEYLEAEYYLRAAFNRGLNAGDIDGQGILGPVFGGRQVPFASEVIRQYAEEIALDEEAHVQFLRAALGGARVARPTIDLEFSFTVAARAAGIIGPDETFDPYANENNFLLGAFIFEDVGVTAYKGAARFIENKDFLEAAAGILAVEAYHASEIRTVLYGRGQSIPALIDAVQRISDLRDSVDGPDDRDQGIVLNGRANIVPSDEFAIAFSRTPSQVLNITYLGGESANFGFFPEKLNGEIR
ncbi:MAG: ferritin-like domain-containing protein [Acidobacteria bacterium]|nr:ferritin-like domain-containing protein [Acidobacteriota bacterium]